MIDIRLFSEILAGKVLSDAARAAVEQADEVLKFEMRFKYGQRLHPRWVYFIQADQTREAGAIKIGKTTGLWARFDEIRRMSPVPLHMVGQFRGSHIHELALHKAFKDARSHFEWFRPTPVLCEVIDSIGHEDSVVTQARGN